MREVGRDLADFARERNVDILLLAGNRRAARRGFLGREERETARRAPCTVIIALTAEAEAKTES